MPAPSFVGRYCLFTAADKDAAGALIGADCPVGSPFSVEADVDTGTGARAWLRNRFGARVGYLQGSDAETVQLALAKGWTCTALLASLYYRGGEEGTVYWGEVALMCYAPSAEMDAFAAGMGKLLADGTRPDVDLGKGAVEQIMAAGGAWTPSGRVPKLPERPGNALVKDHISFNERLIEMSRERKVGCMVVGWAFIALLVVGAVFLLRAMFGF